MLVIGDSLMREVSLQSGPGIPTSPKVKAALAEAGGTPTVVCWKGRTTEWTREQVDTLAKACLLPRRVVIATGTNDMWIDDASLPSLIVEPDLDGVHMTMSGARERARGIVEALSWQAPNSAHLPSCFEGTRRLLDMGGLR